MTPTLFAVFAAVFTTTAIYLFLVWRLIVRWNALSLGSTIRFQETPAVLRAIWGRAPVKRDETFLRLRGATRVAFALSGIGILAWFYVVFLVASQTH